MRLVKLAPIVAFLLVVLPAPVSSARATDTGPFLFAGELDGVTIHLLVKVSNRTAVGAVVRFDRESAWDMPVAAL